MKIVYTYEEPPKTFSKSIFLAGPTPRIKSVKSWRPDALKILEDFGYDGVVFVPEFRPGFKGEWIYPDVPAWEQRMLDMADCILFWIPRELETMPAFTTNVEFGLYSNSGKVVLGAPVGVPKMRYLWFVADKLKMLQSFSLDRTILKALEFVSDGAKREGGEREVPLQIWNTKSFQSWYQSHKEIGNRLDGAKVYWNLKIGPNRDKVFYWVLHPNIYIASENRNKTNESFISRFDISSVVLYKRRPDVLDSEIILVREFRSPVRNKDGMVWELPGDSSPTSTDPLQTIVEEIFEEVGLEIDKTRLKLEQTRQMAATLSTHCGTLYSAELSERELAWCKDQKNIPHGADYPEVETGERVYTEVLTLREIKEQGLVDWGNLGMISQVLGI